MYKEGSGALGLELGLSQMLFFEFADSSVDVVYFEVVYLMF